MLRIRVKVFYNNIINLIRDGDFDFIVWVGEGNGEV